MSFFIVFSLPVLLRRGSERVREQFGGHLMASQGQATTGKKGKVKENGTLKGPYALSTLVVYGHKLSGLHFPSV